MEQGRNRRNERMEGQGQLIKSRVVRVNSEESWDFLITEANNKGCPVFVHFTASWCAPSLAMNPFFLELANNFQDILFIIVDVDEAKVVARKMEVKAMPTFVLLKEGKVEAKMVGANPEEIRKRMEIFAVSSRATSVV